MTFNTNAFWGSSDSDTFRCQTPPIRGLSKNPPNWDGVFDFTESIDPKSSLELLQGPLPCTYEPPDEWLVEFKRLQDVHDRAQAVGVQTISAPLYHEQNVFAASNISSYQPEISNLYPSQPQRHSRDEFSKNDGQACIRDEIGSATPSPMSCSCSTDGRSPGLYDWNPIPAYDSQQALGDHDVQMVMKGLREIEQNLQADTKRRMCQIEQSRPG
ncbi:hypothetical protein F4782DRAFT_511013 [Xylaria castorea]|nr:hypothetical protein F4782DRAFT_511013 [Xylaria castorea]